MKAVLAATLIAYLFALLVALLIAVSCSEPRKSDQHASKSQGISSKSPPDFSAIDDVKTKKKAFFSYVEGMAANENLRIQKNRTKLLAIYASYTKDNRLSKKEQKLVETWFAEYKINTQQTLKEKLQELKLRMNTIPRALVLAQAAIESGWGTSRFARQANNYFGQWCFSNGCGLVPKNRNNGAVHEVQKFNSPSESIAAYMHNLNTFHYYEAFRVKRNQFEAKGTDVIAMPLVDTLSKYSERGEAYLKEVRHMIKANKLE